MEKISTDHVKLVVVIISVVIQFADGQTYENMTQLRSDLLQNYHPDVLPMNNQSEVMKVNVTLKLYNILEVDSVKGVLTVVCQTYCTWVDERLKWNPLNYGGIQRVLYYQNKVWKPPITLGTPIEFTTMWNSELHATVLANGLASMEPGGVIESSCKFNMKYWPLDKQVCDIMFFTMDYYATQIQLNTPEVGFYLFSNQSAEWTVEKIDSFPRSQIGFDTVVYRVYLKRQAMFYILAIILPIIGMTIVTSLVFLLPNEAGERVGYSITMMLALAVFLTIVADQMPKTSEPMALVCGFLFIGVIISLVSMVIVILNMRVYYKSDQIPVGRWYRLMVKVVHRLLCNAAKVNPEKMKMQDSKAGTDGTEKTANKTMRFDVSNTKSQLLFVMPQESEISPKGVNGAGSQDENDDKISWQDVSKAIDMVTFTMSTLFTTIGSSVFSYTLQLVQTMWNHHFYSA